jgi:glutamate 5-kinase
MRSVTITRKMAGEAIPGLSTGGMKSKVEAAISATQSGVHLIISKGKDAHALRHLIEDKNTCSTLFFAKESPKNARKKWIGSHLRPKGTIFVDDGAISALKSGKSLLPVGVKLVEGKFERGDIIEVKSIVGQKIAMGIIAYNSEDAVRIIGKGSQQIAEIVGYAGRDELVHRNDLALLA